eukprot:TRINITY_DN4200_c0_g1_i5.p1 TRINITY_DN4200_c0_g1~~TRINITY_DN4200_c0_g1_i5.p1  ORF type:complete len:235 (-),score=34.27 TRINITY_DN4200_c0_g1_i5:113-817(-)
MSRKMLVHASTLLMASVTSMASPSFSGRQQATPHTSQPLNKGFTFEFSDSQKFSQQDLDAWFESSDTVRQPGMSKAVLTLQKLNKQFIGVDQRGIFFALLNPQPNGAGFAGMKRWLNDSDFQEIENTENEGVMLKCRAQGLSHWKIIFYHKMENVDPKVTYESFFDVTPSSDFKQIQLNLDTFQPYFRGKPVDTYPLDRTKIAGIGIQAYGGVYSRDQQSGPGTLELETLSVQV